MFSNFLAMGLDWLWSEFSQDVLAMAKADGFTGGKDEHHKANTEGTNTVNPNNENSGGAGGLNNNPDNL